MTIRFASRIPTWRLRRWLPSALAVFAVGATPVFAQVAPAPGPVTPLAQPPMPMPPAAVALKPGEEVPEKTVSFVFDEKPWKSVLDWFAKESGLVLNSSVIPDGSVTIKPNPGHKYTIPQVLDLLNESLAQKNYIIIRRSHTFSVLPADVKVPKELLPKIGIEELTKKGDTEMVEVTYTLKALLADDIITQLLKRKGPFGEINTLGAKTLIISDTARNVRLIIKDLQHLEDDKVTSTDQLTYKCKFIRASTAAEKLKALLTDSSTQVITSATAAPSPYGGYSGYGYQPPPDYSRGRDSRSTPSVAPRFKSVNIEPFESTNTILITGPDDKIAAAAKILKEIDIGLPGQKERIDGPVELRNYGVAAGTADNVTKTLTDIYKASAIIRITALPLRNEIMVYAPVADHFDIAQLLKGSTEVKSSTIIEVIPITSFKEPKDVVDQLKRLYPDSTGSGATMDPSTDPRPAIIVKGTQQQIDDIKMAYKAIDGGLAASAGGATIRMIPVENGNSAMVAEAIANMLRGTRTNPVELKGGPSPAPVAPAPVPVPGPDKKSQLHYPRPAVTQISHQIADPQAPAQPKVDPTKKPVTITVIGGKIIIQSDDPEALELASQFARLFLKEATVATDNLFKVIPLRNNSAEEAAKEINELFNGPPPAAQGNQAGGRGGPGGGGGGFSGGLGMLASLTGLGGTPAASAPATPNRVRVVAEKQSNSLIVVKASPLDLRMMEELLKTIDSSLDLTSANASKPHILTLKNARAEDVKATISEVYSNLTSARSGARQQVAFNPFMPQQPQSAQPAQLTVSIEDRTNSVIVNCNDAIFAEIEKLVTKLDEMAKNQSDVVKVVKLEGIDPALVEEAIRALNGTPATTTGTSGQRQGGQQGSGGGFSPFGGGFSPFGGGGMTGGGQRGGGGGGQRGGGTRGGGRNNRAPDYQDGGGGRDHFSYRDMDVPSGASMIYDPEAPQLLPVQYTEPIALPQVPQPTTPQPIPMPMPGVPAQPSVVQGSLPAPADGVTAEAIPNTPLLVLRTKNPEDMARLLAFIEFIRKDGEKAQIKVQLVPMKHQDATSIVNILNTLFSRVQIGPGSTTIAPATNTGRTGGGFQGGGFAALFGGGQQQSSASSTSTIGSIFMLPLPRFNSIMLAVPESRLADVLKEIERLDVPNSGIMAPTAFPLKNASASNVSQQIQSFFNGRYGIETQAQNQIRVFFDANSNTVYVQASPADIQDIGAIINKLDSTKSISENELKIFKLRNAYSDEIAQVLYSAITSSAVNPSLSANAAGTSTTGGAGALGATQFGTGAFGAGAQPGGQLGAQAGRGGALGGTTGTGTVATAGTATKTTSLAFYSQKDGKFIESGFLLDTHIIPYANINSLVISAPAQTMRLIEKLIEELDVPGAASSSVKVFTLKKSDATTVATLIQQLFSSSTTTGGGGGQFGGLFGGAGAAQTQTGNRPLLTLTGDISNGAALVDLRLSVDARTNSVIVAGSPTDLDTIRAIIAKLEDAEASTLLTKVYKLRNAAAADVQTALLTFLQQKLQAEGLQYQSVFQTLQRQVFIQAEPVSNTLLIAVAPHYYNEVVNLVEKIDAPPPQVFVQVLIAEVTLRNNEEFGMEFGIQSPVLFARSSTGGTPGTPGFNFNTTALPLGNATIADPGVVGFQGLGSLGVGRQGASGVGGFVFSAGSDTFNLLIRALKAQSRIDVLSKPQLLLTDNQTGFFQVGQQYPILDGQTTSPNVGVTNNITYIDIGITLRVTPRINPDGRVLMRVEPQISNPDPQLVQVGGQQATSFSTQTVQTTVLASDGETVVLGGLMRRQDIRTEQKIPVLGDIPYLGAAFRYRTQQKERREIIFIVTPHLIRSEADMARIGAMETCKMNWVLKDVLNVNTYGEALLSGRNPYEGVPPGVGIVGGTPLQGGVQTDGPISSGTPTPFGMPLQGGVVPEVPAPLPGTPISASPRPLNPGVVPAVGVVPNSAANVDRPLWPSTMETPKPPPAPKPVPAPVAPAVKPREGQAWNVFGR